MPPWGVGVIYTYTPHGQTIYTSKKVATTVFPEIDARRPAIATLLFVDYIGVVQSQTNPLILELTPTNHGGCGWCGQNPRLIGATVVLPECVYLVDPPGNI